MEWHNTSAGWAYVIGLRWSVEYEFSVEYCVPYWERLGTVIPEEKPLRVETVLVLMVYLRTGMELL